MTGKSPGIIWRVLGKNGTGIFRVGLNRLLPGGRRFDRLIIYSQNLSPDHGSFPAKPPALQISRISGNLDPLFLSLVHAFPEKRFEDRLIESGNECYVAHFGDEIVGYAWTVESEVLISEINYRYAMHPTEFFIYDCYVKSQYRGMEIYPSMLTSVMTDTAIRRPKLTRATIGVFSVNRPSHRGVIKAGFIPSSCISYLRWGNTEKWWYGKE